MIFLKALFLSLYRVKFKTACLLVLPIWLLVIAFIYTSYYVPIYQVKYPFNSTYDRFDHVEVVHLHLHSEYLRLKNKLEMKTKVKSEHLPVFNLYFKDHDLAKLFSDLPESGRKYWIAGKLILNDKQYEVEARLRGGSYWHWSFPHKSWRVKLKNNERVFGQRIFDIVNPKVALSSSESLVFKFARKLGLWNVENRMVRLNINNKYSGHSFTLSFLNNDSILDNQKTSGSLYGIDFDNTVGDHFNFHRTSIAWRTGRDWTTYSQIDHNKNEKLELYEFAKVIRSKYSADFIKFFQNHFDVDKILTQMSLDSLLGIFHRSRISSQRFYYNNKEGKFNPILWDSLSWMYGDHIMFSRNPIYDRVRKDPKLNSMYIKRLWNTLYRDLGKDYILESIRKSCQQTLQAVADDPSKDAIGVHHFLGVNKTRIYPYTTEYYKSVCEFHEKFIQKRYEFFDEILNKIELKGKFYNQNNVTRITLSHESHLSPRLEGIIADGKSIHDIYIDSNRNDAFDSEDRKLSEHYGDYLYSLNGNRPHKTKIDFTNFINFFGRINLGLKKANYLYFIPGHSHKSIEVELSHPFTKKLVKFKLKHKDNTRDYVDLHRDYRKELVKRKQLRVGPGIIEVTQDLVYSDDIFISAGTEFFIAEGVNIIFKGKTVIDGHSKNKVIFRELTKGKLFGSIVLEGNNTSGSRLSNVEIRNGSIGMNTLREFSGLLSVYKSSDIKLSNIVLSSSCVKCYGITIYKTKDFDLEKIHVKNLKNHHAKIELSNGIIKKSEFHNSLGSGIDLMFSDIYLSSSSIRNTFVSGINIYKSKVTGNEVKIYELMTGIISTEEFNKDIFQFEAVSREFKYEN